MIQGDNSGYNKGENNSHLDITHPQNENIPMNEPNPFPNLLDINLNSSYRPNNGEVCIFQNNNNFSYLNGENCQNSSMNIYNQCDEGEMDLEEEINTNKDQQADINEKDFNEELEKQKKENQSLKFDFKDYCVEKEMRQSGNDLSDSFLDEQFFLNDILFPSEKNQNILHLIEIEGNADNFDINKNKESKTLPKEKDNNQEGLFQSKGGINEDSVNSNKLNFFEEKRNTENSIMQEEPEQNEFFDIFSQKSEEEPKFETEELKEIKNKYSFSNGKNFEDKFCFQSSGSTKDSINVNNSSNNQSNAFVGINSISNDEDSINDKSNNIMNFLEQAGMSDIKKERKFWEISESNSIIGDKMEVEIFHSSFSLPEKSFNFGLNSNKSHILNNNLSSCDLKRDRVIEEIEARMKKIISSGDLEKRIHKEFKCYLKKDNKYKKIFGVNNDFWKKYSKSKINMEINGKEIKSYSHELSEYLFKFEGIAEKYEEFLEDIKFHDYYKIKTRNQNKKTSFNIDFELYRKNFHKIYCNKYQVSDLYLPKFIAYKNF